MDLLTRDAHNDYFPRYHFPISVFEDITFTTELDSSESLPADLNSTQVKFYDHSFYRRTLHH
jgi:hypothetical protein